MSSKISIKKENIAVYLLILISVFPAYYHIMGRMVSSVILVPVLFLTAILGKASIKRSDFKSMALFFIWVLIKSLIYVYHGEAFRAASFSLLIISIALIVPMYVSSKEKFLSLIDLMLYVSVFLCILGIIEGITGFNPFIIFDTEGNVVRNLERLGIVRIISFTAQATHYALYVSIMALLAIYRVSIEKTKREKNKFYIIMGLNVINLMLTLTRSTIVCFIACVLMIIFKMGVGRFIRIILIVLIGTIVVSVFFEESFLGQFIYMMLALVFPSFSNRLSSGALSEYANGVADRVNLYKWVYESVSGHMILGMGERTQFAYFHKIDMVLFSYYETKRSIEVYVLYLLYHFGLVGAISEMLVYIQFTLRAFRNSLKRKMQFENRFNFDFIMFIILIMNIINWFAVAQGEESTTIYTLLFIWISYIGLKRKEFITSTMGGDK